MKFPFFIARRYLVSKNKPNIINIISGIAVLGVSIGTIALLVVLSVFNGFDSLVKSLFSSFDPDLKIEIAEGKSFDYQQLDVESIKNIEGVNYLAYTLEENAILKYDDKQKIAIVKGVSSEYLNVASLDSHLVAGNSKIENESFNYALVGYGVALQLGISINFTDPIQLFAAKKGIKLSPVISRSFNDDFIFPCGIFLIQDEIDSEYIVVPLDFARVLFSEPINISSIEIKLHPDSDIQSIQSSISQIVGDMFHVKNKYQQHELLFKMMNSEKWAIYFILAFILIIASFNILGSLSMLIIDKKDDIEVLKSMGADNSLIKKIFLIEGWLISILGAFTGLILGLLICWLQNSFELLKFPENGTFAVPAYPVEVHFLDVILVFFTVVLIGFLLAWYPVKHISSKIYKLNY